MALLRTLFILLLIWVTIMELGCLLQAVRKGITNVVMRKYLEKCIPRSALLYQYKMWHRLCILPELVNAILRGCARSWGICRLSLFLFFREWKVTCSILIRLKPSEIQGVTYIAGLKDRQTSQDRFFICFNSVLRIWLDCMQIVVDTA